VLLPETARSVVATYHYFSFYYDDSCIAVLSIVYHKLTHFTVHSSDTQRWC